MDTTTETKVVRRTPAPAGWDLTSDEARAYELIPSEVDYVEHSSFAAPETEEVLFGSGAEPVDVPQWTHFPEVEEEADATPTRRKALSSRNEVTLFLRYNYARYRLARLVAAQRRRKSAVRARHMLLWHGRASAVRAALVRANMALVLAMAKRTRIPSAEFTELISEGNMALLRAVEKFDVSRGFKFSTYGCRAILKSFNRLATKTARYRQHFPTEFDPDLEHSDRDIRRHETQREDTVDAVREILTRDRAHLTAVEKTVVMERFAIGSRGRGRTLAEVGRSVGLTNERVRQIQNHALGKIRAALNDDYLTA